MTFHFLARPRAFVPAFVATKIVPRPRATMTLGGAPIASRRKRTRAGLRMHWVICHGRLEMRWEVATDASSP